MALGAGALMLALVVLTGVAVVTAVAKNGGDMRATGWGPAEEDTGDATDGREEDTADGSGGGSGGGGERTPGANGGVASYTGPEAPTRVTLGAGPYTLPDDLCAGIGQETLDGLGLDEEGSQTDAGGGDSANGSCVWHRLADDGSFHTLQVRYSVLSTESVAGIIYQSEAVDQTGILGDVVEEAESDIGDASKVVLIDNGEGSYEGRTFIRRGNAVVIVEREIQPSEDAGGEPTLGWGPTKELMPELGRQALNNLG